MVETIITLNKTNLKKFCRLAKFERVIDECTGQEELSGSLRYPYKLHITMVVLKDALAN